MRHRLTGDNEGTDGDGAFSSRLRDPIENDWRTASSGEQGGEDFGAVAGLNYVRKRWKELVEGAEVWKEVDAV